jgi:hypothetical protein
MRVATNVGGTVGDLVYVDAEGVPQVKINPTHLEKPAPFAPLATSSSSTEVLLKTSRCSPAKPPVARAIWKSGWRIDGE